MYLRVARRTNLRSSGVMSATMPMLCPSLRTRTTRLALAAGLWLGVVSGVRAQDVYFSQPFATRLHTNPAFTGLVDDYSLTLSYHNQHPTVAAYTHQGGSQRIETGLYFTASPVTLGAVYRNIFSPGSVGNQHVLALVAGIEAGGLRVGYSYDAGISRLSADLGGAHELTLAVRAFDRLENAHRRLKRRVYPLAPCPAF